MAFLRRISQSKLRQLSHQSKSIPFAALLNPTLVSHSKACVSESPYLISPSFPTDFGGKVRFFAAPVQANPKKVEQGTRGPRMNEKIQAQVVRLVLSEEEHFVISTREALERARKLELDLVEVEARTDPPICKIMDYHREKYKKELREKEKLKSRSDKTLKAESKEVKFSSKTEAKDLKMKADMVKRFMEKGYRVKCTASNIVEDQDLGALFSRLTVLIEDVALVECEPTLGKGKEAYIIVRHVKFGPSKKGAGKKTKTDEKTIPEVQNKGKDGANDVTSQVADKFHGTPTRAHTVPMPPRESSDVNQNRYRTNESRHPFSPTQGMDNRGPGMREPHVPYQRRGTPTDRHFSPPMGETRQAETTNAPVFRNSTAPRNDMPKQEPMIPGAPRSPGLGFGVFSNPTGNVPGRQGVSERFPANSNGPSSRPDSSQRPGTGIDKGGQGRFGVFGRESSSESPNSPNRISKPN